MFKIIVTLIMSLSIFLVSACDSTSTESEPSKVSETIPSKNKTNTQTIKTHQENKLAKVEKNKTTLTSVSKTVKTIVNNSLDGEQIYNEFCESCHATGVARAPKLGDAVDWMARINKGIDALYISAIKGVPATAMPPKGACSKCSDNELKTAVDFMVSKIN